MNVKSFILCLSVVILCHQANAHSTESILNESSVSPEAVCIPEDSDPIFHAIKDKDLRRFESLFFIGYATTINPSMTFVDPNSGVIWTPIELARHVECVEILGILEGYEDITRGLNQEDPLEREELLFPLVPSSTR